MSMARPKKPANLQTGHTYSKTQLKEMARLEEEMCCADDVVNIVPEYLNEYAKVYYRYLIDNLKESGIAICNLDRPLIETTADCLSRIYIARKAIDEEGMVFDKDGKKMTNPYVKIHLDYMNKLTQLTSRLGLDPSSRSTLASLHIENKEEEQDEVMQLIKSLKE